MARHILIGTTAINRPDLHKQNMENWLNFVSRTDDCYLTWFLNIDTVKGLPFSYQETLANFNQMKPDNIELIVLPQKSPGFLNACQAISKKMLNFVRENELNEEDVYVMWLEDDWQLNNIVCEKFNNFNYFFDIMNSFSYVNLSFLRPNYIWALSPSLMGYKLFKMLFYQCWNQSDINGDPEHLLGVYYLKLFGKPEKLKTINIIDNQLKKIKIGYFDQPFTKLKNAKNMILDETYKPKFEVPNNIKFDQVKSFLGKDINFIRLSPGWCLDGVDFGRNYMKKINLTKWTKGDNSCQYNTTN